MANDAVAIPPKEKHSLTDKANFVLSQITKEMKQYQTPSLNDKLYLHFKVR